MASPALHTEREIVIPLHLPNVWLFSRSVEQSERSLSLGLQTILLRAVGTVPGPIILGFVMDQTCVLWKSNDQCSSGVAGSCLMYDNYLMSVWVLIILVVWRFIGLVLFGVALYYNQWSTVRDEDVDEDHHLQKE